MKKYIFLLFILFAGCKKEPPVIVVPENADSFIFGTSYGYCFGTNCTRLFKLEGDKLFPDVDLNHLTYNMLGIFFQTESLPADKVMLAESLKIQTPATLLNEPEEIIGCPDCRDQGVIYIETRTGGQVRKWYIDPDVNEYASFCDSVRAVVHKMPK